MYPYLDDKRRVKISKSVSYWLRHKPEDIGLYVGSNGWVDVKELINKAEDKLKFDFNELKQVVQKDDKMRFSFSDDLCSIKCNQGHSVDVDLEFPEVRPPEILYHGAPNNAIGSILKNGLNKGKRHHCHLSQDIETAGIVGARRGSFTILKIEAMRMRADGLKIYISDNGVYLVDFVPAKYISV